jgi:DNA-binding CsgD family transcriptional regulator
MGSASPALPTNGAGPHGGLGLLSKREAEVLAVTARGLTNRETAAQLGVSVHAVKFHLAGVYRKLHVANRTQAVAVFVSAKPELSGD